MFKKCGQLFGFNLDTLDQDDILDEDLDPEIIFNPKGGSQQAEEEVMSDCEDDPQPSTSGTRPTYFGGLADEGMELDDDVPTATFPTSPPRNNYDSDESLNLHFSDTSTPEPSPRRSPRAQSSTRQKRTKNSHTMGNRPNSPEKAPFDLVRLANESRKVCWYNAAIFSTLALCRSLGKVMIGNGQMMDFDQYNFMDYFRMFYNAQDCERMCPMASLTQFIREFLKDQQDIKNHYDESRRFFLAMTPRSNPDFEGCPYFRFMQPTSVTQVIKDDCSRCGEEGFNRTSDIVANGFFDIPLPDKPRNVDETLATLTKDAFTTKTTRLCDKCEAPVTTTQRILLLDGQEGVVLNLGRFKDNPALERLAKKRQSERQKQTKAPEPSTSSNSRQLAAIGMLKQNRRVKLCNVALPLLGNGEDVEYEIVATVEHRGSTNSGKCENIMYL